MPKNKKKNRKTGKNNKIEPPNTRYTMVARQSPVAMRYMCTLRYAEDIKLSGLTVIDYVYNLNSIYDPNFTGTGHQPMGRDQLAALYARYRVYRARYQVSFSNTTTTPTICVCFPANGTSGYVDAAATWEGNKGKTTIVNQYQTRTLRGSVDLAMLNGKSREAYASDDTTGALMSTSPTEILALHILAESIDATANINCFIWVRLEYDCELSDPVPLSQS